MAEPTHDLDVDPLRALEDALLSFAGYVVVISHDRWLLDRIATRLLACKGDLPCQSIRADRRLGVYRNQAPLWEDAER